MGGTRATLRLGEPPLQIDLLLQLSGVDYEQVRPGAIEGSYGDVPVRFVSLPDLIANKRAAGREKDLADVKALEAGSGGSGGTESAPPRWCTVWFRL